jgi:DNA-binding NarL/FixJ family response regulator
MNTSQSLGLAMYLYVSGGIRKIRLFVDIGFHLASDVCIDFYAYIMGMAHIRVLIVDDVEQVRQDLSTFLTLAGDIEVVGEAGNGWEALRLVESLCPQVVLMDIEMPIMDGYEAARRIKVNRPSCRVIALTIHASGAERQKALQVGMDDVIAKGDSLDLLLKSIRALENTDLEP